MQKSPGGELKAMKTRKSELATQLAALQREAQALNARLSKIQSEKSTLLRTQKSLDRQIYNLKTRAPVVTEHAIIRYLERVLGMDMEDIRNELLTDGVLALHNSGGSGAITTDKGYKVVVKKGVVVTITGGEFGKK